MATSLLDLKNKIFGVAQQNPLLNAIQGGIKPVFNQATQNRQPFFSGLATGIGKFGTKLQQFNIPTNAPLRAAYKAFAPTLPTVAMGLPVIKNLVQEQVRSYGRGLEMASTPQGRQQFVSGLKQTPLQVSRIGRGGGTALLRNPSVEQSLNLLDVAGVTGLARRAPLKLAQYIPTTGGIGKISFAAFKPEARNIRLLTKKLTQLGNEDIRIMEHFYDLAKRSPRQPMGVIGQYADHLADFFGIDRGIGNKRLAETFQGILEHYDKLKGYGGFVRVGKGNVIDNLGIVGKRAARQPLPTQPKGVEAKPIQLKRIKVAQEEALQQSTQPQVQVKRVAPIKVNVVSDVGGVSQKTPGGIQGPSAKSITQDKYSFNVNMNRVDLTKPEKQTLRTTVETVKPELVRLKGKTLSNDEVLKAAKSSEMLQQTTTREQTLAAEAAVLKARQTMVGLDKEIEQLIKAGNTPQLQAKMRELVDSLRVVSSNAADTGRKLQALSIEAGDETIRSSILKGVAGVETDTDRILKEAVEIDWNNANSIAAFYRKFIQPTTTEILDEFRYNNMLSNPRTHIRNAFSNLVQTFITRPATLLAQGRVGETAKYYQGAIKSLPDAFGAFSDAFSGKAAIAKPDIEHISTLKLPKFLTVPTRAMEASDRFFSKIISGGELARGATLEEAGATAQYSLFRQGLSPKGQGAVLNSIDNATKGIYELGQRIPLLRWFVPFVRTPMNFAKQWIEYSPLGLTTLPGAANKGEQIAKTMLGSMVTLMGAKLALDGNTTWAAPTDPKEKELFYASGRKPYSVKLGGKWVSMMYFGPFAYAIALPSATNYYQTENRTALTDSQMDKLGKITSSMAEFLSGQTFMEGLGNFVSLLRGDNDYSLGKNLGYTASQFIPLQGLVRWASTLVDPVYRKAKTAPEQIMSTLPFLSKNLPAYTDPFGQPSKREPINLVTPYDITTNKGTFESLRETRQNKLQENAVINQLEKDMAAGESIKGSELTTFTLDGTDYQGYQVGDRFIYLDDNGEVATKSIKAIEKEQRNEEKGLVDANYSLSADRLNRSKDAAGWQDLTQNYIDYLREYKKQLDPKKEAKELITIQNKIEDLENSLSKSKSGKKPKKITIKKLSLSPIKIKKSARIKIKAPKPPKITKSKSYTYKVQKVEPIKIVRSKPNVKVRWL